MAEPIILVAGNAGQVAQALVSTAPSDQIRLTSLGRPHLDLTDPASVRAVVERVRPNLVINAAAYTAVDHAESDEASAHALNASGAGFLAQAAAEMKAPILHLSTDYVFNGEKKSPYVETDPVAPLGAYGRSKLAGEIAVAAANPRHLIFRTAWVFSPVGKNFMKTMLRVAETRDELGVVHDQIGNPTSASDIAAALWLIATQVMSNPDRIKSGVYNLSASGEATWAEFAEEIFRASAAMDGPVARVKRLTSDEYPTPTRRPANSRLDCTKLSREFGVILPQWQSSTHTCVQQLMSNRGWAS